MRLYVLISCLLFFSILYVAGSSNDTVLGNYNCRAINVFQLELQDSALYPIIDSIMSDTLCELYQISENNHFLSINIWYVRNDNVSRMITGVDISVEKNECVALKNKTLYGYFYYKEVPILVYYPIDEMFFPNYKFVDNRFFRKNNSYRIFDYPDNCEDSETKIITNGTIVSWYYYYTNCRFIFARKSYSHQISK